MLAAVLVWCPVPLSAQTAGRGAPPPSIGPRPQAGPPDRPPVDRAAADRGRAIYAAECVTCHAASARGTDSAPSLIRSIVVLNDRYGSLLMPFFQEGHPMQSGRPSASLTVAQAVDLMHFLRQRINDTLRGSEVFAVGDIVTGRVGAGRAFFEGGGRCTSCHAAGGDLAGIASRLPAVDLQQRMLFPLRRAGRGGTTSRTEIAVVVSRPDEAPLSGTLVQEDDFFVTLRDRAGVVRVVRKAAGVSVEINDPLRPHHELLDRITDDEMHDLVAYLVTLK
jgi:mono/diheme cytochrome c family protein